MTKENTFHPAALEKPRLCYLTLLALRTHIGHKSRRGRHRPTSTMADAPLYLKAILAPMNAVSLLVGVKQVALLPGAIFPLLASVDPDGVFGACGGKVCAKSCVTAPFVFQIIGCLLVMTSIAKLVCAFGKQTERGGASFMPLTLGMVDGLVAHVCARFAETGTGGAIFAKNSKTFGNYFAVSACALIVLAFVKGRPESQLAEIPGTHAHEKKYGTRKKSD